jgi:hypothetical protein
MVVVSFSVAGVLSKAARGDRLVRCAWNWADGAQFRGRISSMIEKVKLSAMLKHWVERANPYGMVFYIALHIPMSVSIHTIRLM